MRYFVVVALPTIGAALFVFGCLTRDRLFYWDLIRDYPGPLFAAIGAAAMVAGLLLRRNPGH